MRISATLCAALLTFSISGCIEPTPKKDLTSSASPVASRPSRGGLAKHVIAVLHAAGQVCTGKNTALAGRGLYREPVKLFINSARDLDAALVSGANEPFDNCLMDQAKRGRTRVDASFQSMVVPIGFKL